MSIGIRVLSQQQQTKSNSFLLLLLRRNNGNRRYYHSTSRISSSERMRVAIVGGGVSGLSTALHLAPLAAQGLISSPIDIYEATPQVKGRSIGVGIWSTALEPFRRSIRESHQLVWKRMTQQGSWVGEVGYRTPKGHWLVHSRLGDTSAENNELPGLLFVKESDVLKTLRTAVAAEENQSTIRMHCNATVKGLDEYSPHSWSAPLLMQNGQPTDRDYHLILAADGLHSELRGEYAGRTRSRGNTGMTGTDALRNTSLVDAEHFETTNRKSAWAEHKHEEKTMLEDRQYTVFRGNAPMPSSTTPLSDDNDTTSTTTTAEPQNFQTWGEGRSMRFATVHMTHPGKDGTREEKQVWFITIDDKEIDAETNPQKRKELLLKAFQNWHDPICEMVAATPADEILAERAMAHSYCVPPVDDMNEVLKQLRGRRPPSSGRGPVLVFMGDAFMTVDPILAQGFSVGMEGAADLPKSIAAICEPHKELLFHPYRLRTELMERHERRLERLVYLLRATEIVQALGQPKGGTLVGFLAKNVLRPLMRLSPNFVKTPFFNAMLTYSLGLGFSGGGDGGNRKEEPR